MEVSPMGWASLITRAMPELLEHNHRFSAYYVNERTTWSEMEVDIINWYLRKMYKMELPSEVLTNNVHLSVGFLSMATRAFFDAGRRWQKNVDKFFGTTRNS